TIGASSTAKTAVTAFLMAALLGMPLIPVRTGYSMAAIFSTA
ncbi:unnamed protein product, partial [marine sediment metagenome]